MLGAAFAWKEADLPAISFLLRFALILVTAVLIQVGTNLANDVLDFERGTDNSERKGYLRITQAGLASPRRVKQVTFAVLLVAGILGLYLVKLGGLPILIIGLSAILLAPLYTAGPFPLAYTGLADVFVLAFFGPVATGGTYLILAGQTSASVLLAGLALGAISTGILAVNNIRDIANDRNSGKKTLAVRFGLTWAKAEYIGMMTAAAVIALVLAATLSRPLIGLTALYLFFAARPIKTVLAAEENGEGAALNFALELTGKALLLYTLLLIVTMLL